MMDAYLQQLLVKDLRAFEGSAVATAKSEYLHGNILQYNRKLHNLLYFRGMTDRLYHV